MRSSPETSSLKRTILSWLRSNFGWSQFNRSEFLALLELLDKLSETFRDVRLVGDFQNP